MSAYYDRGGNPITAEEWSRTFKPARGEDGQPEPSRHVGRENVDDSQGREHMVSTVWLGLDHGYGDVPLIFETMVFCHDHECEWDGWQARYSSEEQASDGHAATVGAVRDGRHPTEDEDA